MILSDHTPFSLLLTRKPVRKGFFGVVLSIAEQITTVCLVTRDMLAYDKLPKVHHVLAQSRPAVRTTATADV